MSTDTVNALFFAALVLVLLVCMAIVIALAHREHLAKLLTIARSALQFRLLCLEADYWLARMRVAAWWNRRLRRRLMALHLKAQQAEMFDPKP